MKFSVNPGQYVRKQFVWTTTDSVMLEFVERCLRYGYTVTPALLDFVFDCPYNFREGSIVYEIDDDGNGGWQW